MLLSRGVWRRGHRAGRLSNLARLSTSSTAGDSSPTPPLFDKILVANRGEIACRVMSTAKRLGIKTVAVYSQPESRARHVQMADEAYCVGPAPSSESYLNVERILEIIKHTGAQGVHPGYGFLSENAAFCEAVEGMGVTFIGPPSRAISAMGDKIESKQIAIDAGINTIPGYQGVIKDEDECVAIARDTVGYPVMIKASAGGGGKGMRIAYNDEEAREGYRLSTEEAIKSFGDDRLFIEKFIEEPHHIEIQLVADSFGKVVCFPERECSIQRRNQKVLEESPSCLLTPETRAAMCAQATQLALAVGYTSAGTVEFLADKHQNFYFLEMNTRLQVEHPVTEYVGRVDLVEQMLKVAAKQPLGDELSTEKATALENMNGWALEARVYAEDPLRGFLPSNGSLLTYREPSFACSFDTSQSVRVDGALLEGMEISTHYDPMISKLITHGETREECIDRMCSALDEYVIGGSAAFAHNTGFLSELCRNPRFRAGETPTSFIDEEYPNGFKGVALKSDELRRIIAAAVLVHSTRQTKYLTDANMDSDSMGGIFGGGIMPTGQTNWVVTLEDDGINEVLGAAKHFEVSVGGGASEDDYNTYFDGEDGDFSGFLDSTRLSVRPIDEQMEYISTDGDENLVMQFCDWDAVNNASVISLDVGDGLNVVQYHGKSTAEVNFCGYKFQTAGAAIRATVKSPREFELSKHMLEPEVKDTSNLVMSPMPGTLISVSVEAGDVVEAGQEVAVVEAMKMQNILRSPRAGVVTAVEAKAGDTLVVEQVIAHLAELDSASTDDKIAA